MLRLALAIALCCAPVGASRALAAAKNPPRVDVVRVDSEQAKHVEIVSQEISADGRELSVVLKPITDQFSVEFDLIGRDFKHVQITVRGVQKSGGRPLFYRCQTQSLHRIDAAAGCQHQSHR